MKSLVANIRTENGDSKREHFINQVDCIIDYLAGVVKEYKLRFEPLGIEMSMSLSGMRDALTDSVILPGELMEDVIIRIGSEKLRDTWVRSILYLNQFVANLSREHKHIVPANIMEALLEIQILQMCFREASFMSDEGTL